MIFFKSASDAPRLQGAASPHTAGGLFTGCLPFFACFGGCFARIILTKDGFAASIRGVSPRLPQAAVRCAAKTLCPLPQGGQQGGPRRNNTSLRRSGMPPGGRLPDGSNTCVSAMQTHSRSAALFFHPDRGRETARDALRTGGLTALTVRFEAFAHHFRLPQRGGEMAHSYVCYAAA